MGLDHEIMMGLNRVIRSDRTSFQVGCDIRSRPLWRELLGLRIKIHNAGLTQHRAPDPPTQTVAHSDPFLNVETKSVR